MIDAQVAVHVPCKLIDLNRYELEEKSGHNTTKEELQYLDSELDSRTPRTDDEVERTCLKYEDLEYRRSIQSLYSSLRGQNYSIEDAWFETMKCACGYKEKELK